jgi:hypothetical protein
MSITINDPALSQAMAAAVGWIDVKDASGRFLGRFVAGHDGKLPPGVTSPFSEEEMERRRKDATPGRPLKDILRDLQAKG